MADLKIGNPVWPNTLNMPNAGPAGRQDYKLYEFFKKFKMCLESFKTFINKKIINFPFRMGTPKLKNACLCLNLALSTKKMTNYTSISFTYCAGDVRRRVFPNTCNVMMTLSQHAKHTVKNSTFWDNLTLNINSLSDTFWKTNQMSNAENHKAKVVLWLSSNAVYFESTKPRRNTGNHQ